MALKILSYSLKIISILLTVAIVLVAVIGVMFAKPILSLISFKDDGNYFTINIDNDTFSDYLTSPQSDVSAFLVSSYGKTYFDDFVQNVFADLTDSSRSVSVTYDNGRLTASNIAFSSSSLCVITADTWTGVVDLDEIAFDEHATETLSQLQGRLRLLAVPYKAVAGMNDNGLTVAIVGGGVDGGNVKTGTQGALTLNQNTLVAYVLGKAGTIEEAVTLLSFCGYDGENVEFCIADKENAKKVYFTEEGLKTEDWVEEDNKETDEGVGFVFDVSEDKFWTK